MKYYINIKIYSYVQLSDIVKKLHSNCKDFAIYFNGKDLFRVFSDNKANLLVLSHDIMPTPQSKLHVCSVRARGAETSTERQKEKRMQRKIMHLQKKGFEFDQSLHSERRDNSYDYFFSMTSASSNKRYKICVKNKVVTEAVAGKFSSYGLSSNGATVPLF